ncbi:hypothetical protein ZOSMA_74G00810 [Zostera marina]|uniref:Uncharacterized protein n=1 Tax=Zostera marina TaxID=29655 RepID=A0A0K9NRP0_ZOSMR|nr:hypothetical protein ZOSMA_74G00810 [Zostera marina]
MTLTTKTTPRDMLLSRGNRVFNNRKKPVSKDQFERNKYRSYSKKVPVMEQHGKVGNPHSNSNSNVISLDGCCSSNASKLLKDRWTAVIASYNDASVDISERPLMYSGDSESSCSQMKLPQQSVKMDFPTKLRHLICNANAAETTNVNQS